MTSEAIAETVIKVGGSGLAHPATLRATLAAVAERARGERLVVIPGGGPFADAVREADRRVSLAADASHWMALLAMDQYAEALTSLMPRAARVTTTGEIEAAIHGDRVPILAPSRWLRLADPLPHSWDVTSDSIAAWVAGALGARRLILIKPVGATGTVVDSYFATALPSAVTVTIVPADRAPHMLRATP